MRDFYLSESVSRQMPGMKDFVSVTVDGEKKHLQKHLVLCNLKEVFELFKEKNPNLKVGFSKFAELWLKQCILAGSSGTSSKKRAVSKSTKSSNCENAQNRQGTSTKFSRPDRSYKVCHI